MTHVANEKMKTSHNIFVSLDLAIWFIPGKSIVKFIYYEYEWH